MRDFFRNLFLPHSGNNHRAKLLYNQTLILVITFLFVASLVLPTLQDTFPQVLGLSAHITTEELLTITNQKRVENGLSPLQLNEELSFAAQFKAKDMFAKNYWAHSAPDGVTPWFFIKKVGYEYTYAGENLARGFNQSSDIINAWMASPSHRENMLSKNYEDIGFAFMEGELNGQKTILVVEMFGNKGLLKSTAVQPSQRSAISSKTMEKQKNSQSVLASIKSSPLITNLFFHNFIVSMLILFIFTLILDMILVEKRKIVRLVGHNADHILFLGMILLIIVIITKGAIL